MRTIELTEVEYRELLALVGSKCDSAPLARVYDKLTQSPKDSAGKPVPVKITQAPVFVTPPRAFGNTPLMAEREMNVAQFGPPPCA